MGLEDFPTLQGEYLSFAEVKPTLSIGGLLDFKTKDFAAIKFNDSLTPSKVRGAGPGIRGRTVGIYDADASVSIYQASATLFKAQLLNAATLQGHNKIGLVRFNLVISWSPLDGVGLIYTTSIIGARIMERSVSSDANSADPNICEMPLSVVRIVERDPITGRDIVLA